MNLIFQPPETKSANNNGKITTFLKSEEFALILQQIVRTELLRLHEQIEELQKEITFLKVSNIELIYNNTNFLKRGKALIV